MMATTLGWKPAGDVEIIAGTPPGGGTDRSARALLKAIEVNHLLDVPAKVVNIAGDGGRKAWVHIAGRTGDANLIGINSPNNATDVLTGIIEAERIRNVPVAILYTEYMAFISRSDSAFSSGAELLKRLAANPKDVTISLSTSLGNPNHIAAAKVIKHAGAPVTAPKIRVSIPRATLSPTLSPATPISASSPPPVRFRSWRRIRCARSPYPRPSA